MHQKSHIKLSLSLKQRLKEMNRDRKRKQNKRKDKTYLNKEKGWKNGKWGRAKNTEHYDPVMRNQLIPHLNINPDLGNSHDSEGWNYMEYHKFGQFQNIEKALNFVPSKNDKKKIDINEQFQSKQHICNTYPNDKFESHIPKKRSKLV